MKYALLLSSILIVSGLCLGANAAIAPGPPSGFSAIAVSPTQINLFWSAPTNTGDSPILGYKIEYKTGSGAYEVLVDNTANTYYYHTGRTTGQSYTYRVSAVNTAGVGTASNEIYATPTSSSVGTHPGSPTGLSAVPVSPTQINLFWSAPSNNGGYIITGYMIEFRVGSNPYSTLVSNTGSASTTYSHGGLTTNQVYVYRVYAITEFGMSQNPSAEEHGKPTSSSTPIPPGAPTGLSAAAVSPTQINLSWNAPSPGSSPITGYKIEVKSGTGSYTTIVSNTGSITTSYSHGGLSTGTAYTYKVSAISSVGTGTASNEASATPTSSSTSGVPGAPTNLNAAATSPTQINLSWTAPSNTGGSPITGYKIEYKVGSGTFTTLVANTQSTATTYSHTGLISGQLYVYRVSAINSVGTGAVSAESSTTSTTSSSASTPGSPGSLTAVAASPTQINLSWTAPSNTGGSPITGYKISVKKGAASFEVLVANTQSTATTFAHTGLTTGTTYYYQVAAINSVGIGSSSETSATPKETVAPTLTATAVSPTSIALSWVPPSQTYKQSITGYKIEEKIGMNAYRTVVDNTNSASTTYTVTGLTTGNTYTFVVSAYFTLGGSPISNEASATPLSTSTAPQSQPTVNPPGTPTGLSATPSSPTQINLSWTAPSNTGGSPITGYKIEVKKGNAQYESLTSTQNSTTKYSHTDLITGTTYYYKVSAISSVGISLPSNEASATPTASSGPQPSQSLPPGGPTLSGTIVSPTQINLSWTAPSNNGGSPITGYKIEYKVGNGSFLTLTSKTTSTTYSHTGLLQNTYSYRVYAINSAGTSTSSNTVSLTITSEEPAKPDEPKEKPVAPFVDPKQDPQYYVDRYNNEPAYKEWFDINYSSQYDSIYEAVGLQEPDKKEPITTHIPGFPDPKQDPQYYVDRYNNEPAFMEWFNANFPGKTIYQVLQLPEPKPELEPEPKPKPELEPEPKPELAQCGPGTHLKSGICVLDKENGGGCLIATAAYGTESAWQVQQLREIRDSVLLRTDSGTAFMTGFNGFYYSFSPMVADWERQNPLLKEAVRITITPMLSTLSVLAHAEIESEQQMLGYGIGIILLNIAVYLGLPAAAITLVKNRHKLP